jgi:RNA polymerase sigma-70 factor (ECF subfamily)
MALAGSPDPRPVKWQISPEPAVARNRTSPPRIGTDVPPDRLLVTLAAGGDSAAFAALYPRYHSMVDTIARRHTQDPDFAADCAQETWLRVFRGLPSFRGESRFSTWLHQVAVWTSLHGCRTRGRKAGREIDLRDTDPDPAALDEGRVLLRICLARALAHLPYAKRRVLVLFDIEGYSHEDIAQRLGITTGTSKSQLFKARARLRELLSSPCELVARPEGTAAALPGLALYHPRNRSCRRAGTPDHV